MITRKMGMRISALHLAVWKPVTSVSFYKFLKNAIWNSDVSSKHLYVSDISFTNPISFSFFLIPEFSCCFLCHQIFVWCSDAKQVFRLMCIFVINIFICLSAADLGSRMSNEPCLDNTAEWTDQYILKGKRNLHSMMKIKKNQVAEKDPLWDLLECVECNFFKNQKMKSWRNKKKEASNNSVPLWDLIRMLQLLLQPPLHSKWQIYVMVTSEINSSSEGGGNHHKVSWVLQCKIPSSAQKEQTCCNYILFALLGAHLHEVAVSWVYPQMMRSIT